MHSFRRLGAAAVALLLVLGCGQDRALVPTSPPPTIAPRAGASGDLLGGVVGTVSTTLQLKSVNGLQRKVALPSDITVRQVIGPAGGVLTIPAAGVTVTVPAGALIAPTAIAMTALHGTTVAYAFAPHGITFAVPLIFTQKLAGTNATLLNAPFLHLGYFTDSSLIGSVTALVSELLVGVVDVLNWSFTAPINHFSGYVVCW